MNMPTWLAGESSEDLRVTLVLDGDRMVLRVDRLSFREMEIGELPTAATVVLAYDGERLTFDGKYHEIEDFMAYLSIFDEIRDLRLTEGEFTDLRS